MIWLVIFVICVAVAVGAGMVSAWSDIQGMVIPNTYPLIVAGAFIPAYIAVSIAGADVFGSLLVHGLSLLATFALTFLMFSFKMIGGGDSKLITAYALWFGGGLLAVFLFFMATAGAMLGLVTIYIKKKKPFKSLLGEQETGGAEENQKQGNPSEKTDGVTLSEAQDSSGEQDGEVVPDLSGQPWIVRAQAGEDVIPYAVAILFGVFAAFYRMDSLSFELWKSFLN